MKKLTALMIGLLTLLVSLNVFAFNVPPAPTDGYLLDQAGVLSSNDSARIRQQLHGINTSTHNEIGVLIVNSLDGESVEDVAHQVFNTWGIGKKGKDNGVLLLVAIADRKMRIETGKGVEGELTDLQSNDILNKKIRPRFKNKDFAGGISDGVAAISSTLESRHNKSSTTEPSPTPSAEADSNAGTVVFIIVVLALLFIIFLIWVVAKGGRGSGGSWGGGGGSSWSSGSSSSSSSSSFGGGSSGGGGSSSDW